MNIFTSLGGHKVVELNQSTGLRTGHMEAQAKFDNSVADLKELDNGLILALDAKGDLVLAGQGETLYFLHYSEEHMTFLDNAPLEMFTVAIPENGYAYPRAIALYEGDKFTTDNYVGTKPELGKYHAVTIVDGVLTVGAEATGKGPIATLGTLPTGKEAIEVIWRGV